MCGILILVSTSGHYVIHVHYAVSYPGFDSRRSTLLESRNQDSIRVQVPDNTPSLRYLISIYHTLSKACIDDNRGNQDYNPVLCTLSFAYLHQLPFSSRIYYV